MWFLQRYCRKSININLRAADNDSFSDHSIGGCPNKQSIPSNKTHSSETSLSRPLPASPQLSRSEEVLRLLGCQPFSFIAIAPVSLCHCCLELYIVLTQRLRVWPESTPHSLAPAHCRGSRKLGSGVVWCNAGGAQATDQLIQWWAPTFEYFHTNISSHNMIIHALKLKLHFTLANLFPARVTPLSLPDSRRDI